MIYRHRSIQAIFLVAGLSALSAAAAQAASLTRGPYLQLGSPTSVVVRWRTDVATNSRVSFGPAPSALIFFVDDSNPTTEHQVTVSSLIPETVYYYSIGSTTETLAGDDANHFFLTPPWPGTPKPTRIWVLGDSGTANASARAVRDAYYAFTGTRHTDLWLMLGDNAYADGTDPQYQAAVFDTYPETLRKSVLFPTLGNHDGHSANSGTQSGPYYDIFTLPKNGEAGGLASGTEAYYSYDHGNVHFIVLDSFGSDRSPFGAMMMWLQADLATTTQDWIIAYWHHPPYSKGSHDSDTSGALTDMRKNALPVLEQGGVDLVLSGHSHSYERSFLLDGHYGTSSTLDPATMILDGGDGREAGTGAYKKPLGPIAHEGAVYTVAGSSGKTSGGTLNHPVMFLSLNVLGSVVLDVEGNRLDATFLDSTGAVKDTYTILKGTLDNTPPVAVDDPDATDEDTLLTIDVLFNDSDPDFDPLTVASVTQPGAGSAAITADNFVNYTPAANFNGPDSFTYTASDGRGGSATATVSVTVNPVNDAPVADNQTLITGLNTPVAITLTASDVDSDPLTFSVVTSPSNGSLIGTAPELSYTPNFGFSGSDSFTFEALDALAPSNVATVSITVAPPVAVDDTTATNEDTAITIDVLFNDSAPVGDPLSVASVTQPSAGSATITADNFVIYAPAANFNGSDSFTYTASDGRGGSATATVRVTVNPVNDAPLANNQSLTTGANTPVAITLTASDVDSDPLTYSVVTSPSNGSLSGTAPALSYTPNFGFSGSDSFTFEALDPLAPSNVATVSITVAPPVTDTGFQSPTANAPVTKSAGDKNGFESNPANAHADDGLSAVDNNSGTGTGGSCTGSGKDKHLFYDYNLSIPAGATIRGIEVRLDAKVDATVNKPKLCVQLSSSGGSSWTSAKSTPTLTTSEATYVLGSLSDLWGRSWTAENFGNTSFRLRVTSVASSTGSTARDFSLDWVAVRVSYPSSLEFRVAVEAARPGSRARRSGSR